MICISQGTMRRQKYPSLEQGDLNINNYGRIGAVEVWLTEDRNTGVERIIAGPP